ncbi:MAG: tyrosine-type recombinase/integrase [Oscillospiraceae bacterium]|nr:tyrosine-type recombinase/integrase [Oscillospiraceae bacterium]
MANIQERRNKAGKITSYRVRVFDHLDVTTGKQIFKNLSVKYDHAKSEAWNRKNAEKQSVIFEKFVDEYTATDSNITFDSYTEYFLKAKELVVASSTLYNYGFSQRKLAPFIGHIKLKDLSPNALNKAYSEMVTSGYTTAKYVRELHTFVHNVLGMAVKEGIIPQNYATAATPPKKFRPDIKAMSEEQINAFFKALYEQDNYLYQVFFSLLLAVGCRIGELCALSWENVDFEEGRVHLCKHFVVDKTGRHVADGCKTVSGRRWVYLDDGIMKMLADYKAYCDKTALEYGSKWNTSINAVFSSIQNPGDYLGTSTVRAWLAKFLKKNNLEQVNPHQFRHTSISLLLQAGISVPDAAKRAGHARPDVTLGIYGHTLRKSDKHCSEAVTKILPDFPLLPQSKAE